MTLSTLFSFVSSLDPLSYLAVSSRSNTAKFHSPYHTTPTYTNSPRTPSPRNTSRQHTMAQQITLAQQIHDVMGLLGLTAPTHVYNYAHYANQSDLREDEDDDDYDNESTGFDQFGNSTHYFDPADPAEELNSDGDSTRDSALQDIDVSQALLYRHA